MPPSNDPANITTAKVGASAKKVGTSGVNVLPASAKPEPGERLPLRSAENKAQAKDGQAAKEPPVTDARVGATEGKIIRVVAIFKKRREGLDVLGWDDVGHDEDDERDLVRK